MSASVQITGVDSVLAGLKHAAVKFGISPKVNVAVGFSAPYAIYVHENLQARHKVGQAKFLSEPASRMQGELTAIILRVLMTGAKSRAPTLLERIIGYVREQIGVPNPKGRMSMALRAAGEALLAESVPLVPVDTGFLRSSGYVSVVEGD